MEQIRRKKVDEKEYLLKLSTTHHIIKTKTCKTDRSTR